MLTAAVSRRSNRGAFVIGLFIGGIAMSFAMFTVFSLARSLFPLAVRLVVAVVISGVALGTDLLPSAHRQVDLAVLRRGSGGWLQFGIEMGTGARTFSPTMLPHLVAVWLIVVNANALVALIGGAAFAAGRATTFLWVNLASRPHAAQNQMMRFVEGKVVMIPCIAAVSTYAMFVASHAA